MLVRWCIGLSILANVIPIMAQNEAPHSSASSPALIDDGWDTNILAKIGVAGAFFCLVLAAGQIPKYVSMSFVALSYGRMFAAGIFLSTACVHLVRNSTVTFEILNFTTFPLAYTFVLQGILFTQFFALFFNSVRKWHAQRSQKALSQGLELISMHAQAQNSLLMSPLNMDTFEKIGKSPRKAKGEDDVPVNHLQAALRAIEKTPASAHPEGILHDDSDEEEEVEQHIEVTLTPSTPMATVSLTPTNVEGTSHRVSPARKFPTLTTERVNKGDQKEFEPKDDDADQLREEDLGVVPLTSPQDPSHPQSINSAPAGVLVIGTPLNMSSGAMMGVSLSPEINPSNTPNNTPAIPEVSPALLVATLASSTSVSASTSSTSIPQQQSKPSGTGKPLTIQDQSKQLFQSIENRVINTSSKNGTNGDSAKKVSFASKPRYQKTGDTAIPLKFDEDTAEDTTDYRAYKDTSGGLPIELRETHDQEGIPSRIGPSTDRSTRSDVQMTRFTTPKPAGGFMPGTPGTADVRLKIIQLKKDTMEATATSVLVALLLTSFLEGAVIGFQPTSVDSCILGYAILIHKVLEIITFSITVSHLVEGKTRQLTYIMAVASSAPVGIILAICIWGSLPLWLRLPISGMVDSLVAGGMIWIALMAIVAREIGIFPRWVKTSGYNDETTMPLPASTPSVVAQGMYSRHLTAMIGGLVGCCILVLR